MVKVKLIRQPSHGNGSAHGVGVEESTKHKWVKLDNFCCYFQNIFPILYERTQISSKI